MDTKLFNSQITLGAVLPEFSQDEIKNEPMLFSCDLLAALHLGGPITRAFIGALGNYPASTIIDTRVHMLMPGWWPCIPGWHHDDVPRSRSDGQPNYNTPEYLSEHALALVGGNICPTEFAIGVCAMPEIPLGEVVYGKWHPIVENLVETGKMKKMQTPDRQIVMFDWQTFHKGAAATGSGWRWFGRASWNTNRTPLNEIRKQTQVYLPMPMAGW